MIIAYKQSLSDEESFLKQKSRINWLQLGDSNSKFFLNACKHRWNSNKILSLSDQDGTIHENHRGIADVTVNYFRNLFGSGHTVLPMPADLHLPSLSQSQVDFLAKPFTAEDILTTLKSMPKNKSPGPDGFTTEFFISAWNVIGTDVEKAVLHFFESGHMPRIVNSVAVALMPKVKNPTDIRDYRPISCCNTLYKCISKMLSQRLQKVLALIISPFQSAFLLGRSIGDNIMLVQALCKDYHLNNGPPRCAMKIDLHKAFDSLNWDFLMAVLHSMNFPMIFINWIHACWIHACISSAMFSIKINGCLEGYFKGNSGLRQRDPLSPYLFVLSMEVLTTCLKKFTSVRSFKYHWRTQGIELNHMVFADDIFLFCHGELKSVEAMNNGLALFFSLSGLQPNWNKSCCFFANIPAGIQTQILQLTGFQLGVLPIKYLGLPLITSRLNARDCQPLLEKFCS